jgi:hypothetical protein
VWHRRSPDTNGLVGRQCRIQRILERLTHENFKGGLRFLREVISCKSKTPWTLVCTVGG